MNYGAGEYWRRVTRNESRSLDRLPNNIPPQCKALAVGVLNLDTSCEKFGPLVGLVSLPSNRRFPRTFRLRKLCSSKLCYGPVHFVPCETPHGTFRNSSLTATWRLPWPTDRRHELPRSPSPPHRAFRHSPDTISRNRRGFSPRACRPSPLAQSPPASPIGQPIAFAAF